MKIRQQQILEISKNIHSQRNMTERNRQLHANKKVKTKKKEIR